MFVIVKLLKRFQEGLRLQLINALFKKVKALIVKHTGVKFFTGGLFLKLTDNSHILKSKQDYVGLNLLLRHFYWLIKALNEELGVLRNCLRPLLIILIHFF